MANNNITLTDFQIINDISTRSVYVACLFGKKNHTVINTRRVKYETSEDLEKITSSLLKVWGSRLNRTRAYLERFLD